MHNTKLAIALLLTLGLAFAGCTGEDDSEIGGESDAGELEDDVGDVGDDTGDNDANNDSDECDPAEADETWVAQPSGEEKCCPAELTCDLLDIDDEDSSSAFDPETGILELYVDTEQVDVATADISYNIAEQSGGGMGGGVMGDQEGTVDGDRLEFDLSEIDIDDNETFELTNLSIRDACDEFVSLMVDAELDFDSTSTQSDFECSEPPSW